MLIDELNGIVKNGPADQAFRDRDDIFFIKILCKKLFFDKCLIIYDTECESKTSAIFEKIDIFKLMQNKGNATIY